MRLAQSVVVLFTLAFVSLVQAGGHTSAKPAASAPSGEAVFEANCAKCHTGGIGGFFSGAPDIDDKEDWVAVMPKGADGLTATTIAGIGGMAERGGCESCSDEEIRAAVDYMLSVIR